jgi:sugar phosphate isomerase/epimerase
MPRLRRRDFLRAALAPLGFAGAARAIDPMARSRPSHLKLSIAAYSYRDSLAPKGKPPTMDLFGFCDLAADMGLDGVELTSYYFPPDAKPAYFHRLKQYAFNLGLDVSGSSVGNNFCVAPGPEREKQLKLVRTWVDNAAELDAPVIRIFAGPMPKDCSEDEAVVRAIHCIKASLPYAIERGVSLALENHGGIVATPEHLLRIVKAIDSPNFGVNLDTGNFHSADPYADLARVAPYAINVQVKTEISRPGQAHEEADLPKEIGILREARYSGYVVLEYEAKEDPFTAIPRHIKVLRGLVG